MDFVFTRMHHSTNHNKIQYHCFTLEDIKSETNDEWTDWERSIFIEDYNDDHGYQSKDHIDKESLCKFIKTHKPRFGDAATPLSIGPDSLPELVGEYFCRNKPISANKAATHFAVQDELNHLTGIDFSKVSQYAAENGVDVCDLDPSEFLEKHRFFQRHIHNNYYIRQANRNDLKAIASLFTGDPEFGFMSNHIVNNFIHDPSCIAIVCCDKTTRVVGSHLAKIMSDNTIHDSYNKIEKESRGIGIGRRMFDTLVTCARKIESPYIYTDCLFGSKSIEFYKHLGLTAGEIIPNSNKQKLLRLYYYLETDQTSLF